MGEYDASEIEIALFEVALGIHDEDVRQAFLVQACGGNTLQLERIRECLSNTRKVDSFFCDAEDARGALAAEEVETLPAPAQESDSEEEGSQIGPYKLLERIGEGGWGVVYMAEQREPVQRKVALKIIRRGLDTERAIARFEIERQSLALMDHHNIARVLDAGATKSGRPYFVMELVHGARITDYCDTQKLDITERIQLFIQVCQATQHAHQKGIIHRDIKPSNILISLQDGQATPKVIDFGIARAAEGRLGDQTSLTGAEQFMGTPAYMSPEQAEGSADLDTRSDVYSLGILLCELLTSATPFASRRLAEVGMFETLRILREEDPLTPSALLLGLSPEQSIAAANARGKDPKHLYSTICGDLDWIVLKAISKDRNLRYSSVNGLATDLQRYLNDEPVLARPPSRLYLFGKLVRRNKATFASAAVVTLALAAGLITSIWFYVGERRARETQEQLRKAAETAEARSDRLLHQVMGRDSVSAAAVLLSEGRIEDADALLASTPPESIKPALEAANTFRVLGDWNAVRNRHRRAADFYNLFLTANRLDRSNSGFAWMNLLPVAPALVQAGDHEEYRRFREDVLVCYQRAVSPLNAQGLLKATLLIPADEAWLERLRPAADVVAAAIGNPGIQSDPNRDFLAMSLGLMEYRRGNFKEALSWSERSMSFGSSNKSCRTLAQAIAALAASRLGKTDQARSMLQAAQKTLGGPVVEGKMNPNVSTGPWHDWHMSQVLAEEAARSLEGVRDGQSRQ